MSYKDRIADFEGYLVKRASVGTTRVYVHALSMWFKQLNGHAPTQAAAQEYIDFLTEKGKSASTISLRAHAIKRWFRWRGKAITLDCPTVRIGTPEYLSMQELEEVLAACRTSLERTLVVVLFDTAVRISELLGLELGGIDEDNGLILVTRKGGREQEVNISPRALEQLKEWIEIRASKSKKVFMDIEYEGAWAIIKKLGKRAKIDLHPHIFRHSRAVQMLRSGATLHTVSQHLGHTSIATTSNIYGRFRAGDLKQEIPRW